VWERAKTLDIVCFFDTPKKDEANSLRFPWCQAKNSACRTKAC
jgi:hypothetical protein